MIKAGPDHCSGFCPGFCSKGISKNQVPEIYEVNRCNVPVNEGFLRNVKNKKACIQPLTRLQLPLYIETKDARL